MNQKIRNDLRAIADRWGISHSTMETVAQMAAARLRREGLPATPERIAEALRQANESCLAMSERMLANPQASARVIRQQLENEGWKTART